MITKAMLAPPTFLIKRFDQDLRKFVTHWIGTTFANCFSPDFLRCRATIMAKALRSFDKNFRLLTV
jgi:hypothetical protein